jgi:hypothetical protein
MSRKVWGLVLFVLAIAIAAVAGTLYLLDADEGPGGAGSDPRVLVDFTRSGGFAGITQQLIVFADGRATLTAAEGANDTDTTDTDLDRDTFERLRRLLPDAVETLDEEPETNATCADCFQYDLIYEGVRYTFYDLQNAEQVTMLLRILDEAICEAEDGSGCS